MIERASTQWLGRQSNPPRSKCRIKPWDVLDEELGGERSGALNAVERIGMYGQGCCGESRGCSNNTSRHNACEERNKMMTGLV